MFPLCAVLAMAGAAAAYGYQALNFDGQLQEAPPEGFQHVIKHSKLTQRQTMDEEAPHITDPRFPQRSFSEFGEPQGIKDMESLAMEQGWDIQQSEPGDENHGEQADPHYFKSALKSKSQFTWGNCSTRLQPPKNSALKCSTLGGCEASCMQGYTFPNGGTFISFVCENGNWKVKGSTDDFIPHCKPTCIPTCRHGGTCVAPNTCECPENISGPYCQFERKRCIGYPPTPRNSRKECNSESCTIMCVDNHEFPDGSGIANVFCRDGEWTPGRPDWVTIPDCKPICIPECQNGGSCLASNKCNCPQQFRGPYCQYSVDACDYRKLNFNGNYNCSESEGLFFCSLKCPGGMYFKSPPASTYSCDYSEGRFHPSSVPQCVFDGGEENSHIEMVFSGGGGSMMSENDIASKFPMHRTIKTSELSSGYSDLINNFFVLEKKTPTPGTCFTWAGYHYKTFDGKVISFKSGCSYVLVSDAVDNTFQIQTSTANCTANLCQLSVTVYVGEKKYQLQISEEGLPVVVSGSKVWLVPNQLEDMRTEIIGYSVVATLQGLGLSLRWNLKDILEVKVTEALWNRTGGLCGRMDGHATNDLEAEQDSVVAYANKWQANPPLGKCSSSVEEDACLDSATQQAAHQFCDRLMTDLRYHACRQILPTRQYYEACRWDFCSCKDLDQKTCGCRSIAMFVHDCLQKGDKSVENWRDEDNCPVECSGGRVYKSCGPATVATCMTGDTELQSSSECVEGCYCPDGMRLHDNHCIPQDQCPCYRRAKPFHSGQKVAKDCNTCECVKGQWSCTERLCEAWCGAIGDPHYQTFDGRRFDFMGKCSYVLLKSENYTIESENIACDGKISENMGFSLGSLGSTPSCTKTVTIRIGDDHILKLKQHKEISINNEDVDSLPALVAGAYVRVVSSMFVSVEMPDGAEVWWDGQTRVYVIAPPALRGKTKGLCGTFNGNQKDDFLTPEGDVEQESAAFANKWKSREVCDNTDSGDLSSHPCDRHVQNRAVAESHCANITSRLFGDCHHMVDPAPYYENCLFDVCSCQSRSPECLCPVMADYAKKCSHEGAVVDWRDKVRGCGVQCPGGQQFQACGSSCAHSCSALARPCARHLECVEGCFCPPGLTVGPHGDCISIASCPCQHNGMEYPPGHKEIRPASKALQYCECKNAVWHCSTATAEQIRDYPNHSLDLKTSCSATRHQEFTHCEPPEPITCKNMHNPPKFTASICRAGCVCRRGYVLDSLTKECVKASQCPCHHGGHSYPDGHSIQEECNTCTCEAGKWHCTEHMCPGVCSAWGDSHFRTFDDRIFDFQGACDYMLAKGSLSDSDSFTVALEIVPCGSSGVSCSRSVTLSVGSGDKHESLTFAANKLPTANGLERITIRQAGLFVFAEVADLGVVLQWDKGTRVILKADPKWKGRLKGLCGNFNGDETDDFQTPSGGISEVSAQLFGDSWKLQPYCPEARPISDTCKLHPTRRTWAVKKCGILKSPVFKPCHSEVPIDPYLERCIFDTCGCDQGGDCECLCTALAAYAQECNAHGVHIKWRTQQLCPVQCDESCSQYKPCVDTCPLETCDNTLVFKSLSTLCNQDTCVEGCEMKPCPEGQVYSNITDMRCVPVAECKPVCLTIDGKDFHEGDFIEGDDCYSCYCSRHKKTCTGVPCTSTTAERTTVLTTFEGDQAMVCRPGWSDWINNDQPIPDKKDSDVEPLPLPKDFKELSGHRQNKTAKIKTTARGQCSRDMMVDIDCRVANTHEHYKEKMQDVECSLENGLVCRGLCDDYEIRVLCQCGPTSATTLPTTITTTVATVTTTTTERTESPSTRRTTQPTTVTTPSTTTEAEVELVTCDVLQPLKPHPSDCSRYYQCQETERGLESLERECALPLWFNTDTMNCDWPDQVKHIRPECLEEGGGGEVVITEKPTTNPTGVECKSDEMWVDCNLRCDQLCLYYEHVLEVRGKCTTGQKCVGGCWPKERVTRCPPGFRWREWGSCVHVDDCTCRSSTGTPVKPGEVIHESDCRVCICEQNHYTCDDSACASTTAKRKTTTTTTETPTMSTEVPTTSTEVPITFTGAPTTSTEAPTTSTEASTTSTEVPTIITEKISPRVFIVPFTVSPPPPCDQNQLTPLVGTLPDSALTASSSEEGSEPWRARMEEGVVGSGWRPLTSHPGEFLQLDLGVVEPVYGVITASTPRHVTSFHVLYSVDNTTFSYVSDQGNPQVFRGSLTGEPLQQLFVRPVEARYVRVLPQTWEGGIALTLEVLGCGPITTSTPATTELPTTIVLTTTTTLPECTDDMGVDSGAMSPQQITVSSAKHPHFRGNHVALSDSVGWIPLLNSQSEYIQIDFLEERTLTGVKTKGTTEAVEDMYEPAWVTSYKVGYSHDGDNWNPVLTPDHTEKVFLGNYDSSSVHTNYFDKPIHARYLRVYPNSWHNIIALKLEVLGCYQPYPITTTPEPLTTETYTTTEGLCKVCEGTSPVYPCPCTEELWWDGEQCTTKTQCPCYVGHIPYAVGSTYETEDCDQCICSLNGLPRCAKKVCPLCTGDLQAVLTPSCTCVCKPCPEGTRLCPTSNVCINSTSWCDGLLDCPDDEVDCTTTTTTTTSTVAPTTLSPTTVSSTTTTVSQPKVTGCPTMECPEGFDVVVVVKKQPSSEVEDLNKPYSLFGSKSKYSSMFNKGGRKGVKGAKGIKGTKGLPPHKTIKPEPAKVVCPEYKCVPKETKEEIQVCHIPRCNDDYELKMLEATEGKCPAYICVPPVVPDGKCNVTGRTIDTFDGLEFKYDICDHVLAEQMVYKEWQIKLKKNCPYVGSCSKVLIVIQYNHTIQFSEDLGVLYDGYAYKVAQVQKIGSQSREFAIKQVSDKFIIFASALGFSVVWEKQGNVKIQVPGSFQGQVDGLCGFFDGNKDNDRQRPDGSQAPSNPKFGESWGSSSCQTRVCPLHIQNLAWKKCGIIKKEPLNQCDGAVNLDKAMSLCVESICECMDKNVTDEDACRCQALLDLVTQCQAIAPEVDLHSWRVYHDCPVDCPPGLVYKECYSRVCEPSCQELLQDDPCPTAEGQCFPGCYCPDGLVRDGTQCIKPASCRDCVCDGFGKSRFVTFDRVDYSFNGNCTHVLAKTLKDAVGPQFTILATNGPCASSAEETCVKSLTTLYLDHVIFVGSQSGSTQSVSIDGVGVTLPFQQDWATLLITTNKDITLSIPDIQLDLVFHGVDLGFSLKLPSHLYKSTTEGLCGNCNNNDADDFKMVDGKITEDSDEFGKSWKVTDLPAVLGKEDVCSVVERNETCSLPPPDSDLCLRLHDEALFGKCHAVVDPEPFVTLCHEGWCQNNLTGCQDLEPYARECRAAGICLDWRNSDLCPYQCPPGLQYKACAIGCDVTCDNVKLFTSDPGACNLPLTESCVCPHDLVWKNGSCVPQSKCQPCDTEGHFSGDTWKPDSCTTCSCQDATSVQCKRTECPNSGVICEQGYKSIVVTGTEEDCCPKYKCLKDTRTTCPPAKQPQCGNGQVMKTVTTADGCQDLICECLPSEECPDISDITFLDPGMVSVIDTSGCCPQMKEVCKPEKCPSPPDCPPFWELTKRDVERCCFEYKCEPPKETCLYEMKFIDDPKGGERERKPSERLVVAKKEGEVWQDGPCRQCECFSHGWVADCTVQKCPKLPSDSSFVIEAVPQAHHCCPEYKRTACRVGNNVFKEGEVIPTDDPCKNLTCLRSGNGELTIHEAVETCKTDCPLGWDYSEAVFSGQCCGQCKPVACVVGTKAFPRGESWQSEDNCTTYNCDISDNQAQVISTHVTCPNVVDCPPENLYKDNCCLQCNKTTVEEQKVCMPEAVAANETVRLVRTQLPSHGVCENYDSIPGFTECQGTCDSFTYYNKLSEHHDSQCQCCQAIGFTSITVHLLCEDGFTTRKEVSVPSQCACEACVAGPETGLKTPLRITKA